MSSGDARSLKAPDLKMRIITATLVATTLLSILGCAISGSPVTRWDWDRWEWDPDAPFPPRPAPPPPAPPPLVTYVVLLTHPDGSVGMIDVNVEGETTTLDRARQGLNFDDPGQTFEMSAEEVEEALGGLLSLEPQSPVNFVVYFSLGGTQITAESARTWEELLAALGTRPVPEITVSGHADSVGPARWNEKLAQSRAQAIKGQLVAAGIDPDAIEVVTYGEDQPALERPDDTEEPLNRRVVIRIR